MAVKKSYVKGSKPRLTVEFSSPDTGDALDPLSVVLKVQDPSGNVVTYTYGTDAGFTKVETGSYYMRVLLDEGGTWEWTFTGETTDDAVVVQGELLCNDPGF